jgi:O-succinylbenzoic acid--CoA ligase
MPENIDWESQESHVLLNPRLPEDDRRKLETVLNYSRDFPGHIWVTSSGTSGDIKLVGLSKSAVLAAAKAANDHLASNQTDVWYNALPTFHVGGLGIVARGYLSKAKVKHTQSKWSPESFIDEINYLGATLTSLVPAQVYDLVLGNHQAPPSLRAVIVGGGSLPPSHYQDARQLGWPLMQSYGLTECASQVATGTHDHPSLRMLNHVESKLDQFGCLMLKSPSLLSAYGIPTNGEMTFKDPKADGWLTTEDMVELTEQGYLKMLGRKGDFIKIGGESVSMPRLEQILDTVRRRRQYPGDIALIAVPDERLGHVIHLAVEKKNKGDLKTLLADFNMHVLPFERIRKVHELEYLPRSPLKKLLRAELLRLIAERQKQGL